MRLDIANRHIVFPGRLQGRVHAPMGKIEEEGPVLVGFDHVEAFIRPPVRQISAWLVGIAIVERGGELHAGPEELVDRVKVQFCVDDIRIVFIHEQAGMHQQAFVKALRVGERFTVPPEVPFADMDGVIVVLLEEFSDRHF